MSVASATILRRSAKQSGGEAASHLADASDPRASSVLGLRDPRFFVRIRGKLGRALLLGIPALVVVAMGVGDLYTPPQLTFGILYLLPIVASGWMLGRRAGFALAGLAALVWLLAEAVSHP